MTARWIIDRVMKSATFLALFCLTHYEIAYVDDVAQLADLTLSFRPLEQPLGLLIENVETVPRTVKPEV